MTAASELKRVGGLHEFLALGTSLHNRQSTQFFTTGCSGQDLYCQIDTSYEPRRFRHWQRLLRLGCGPRTNGHDPAAFAGGEVREYSVWPSARQ